MTAAVGCLPASVDWIDDEWDSGRNPDLWLYRKRTEKILRKYFRMSVEVGRLPSILGSEFFRTHVTSYSVSSFEDAVIFVHDVERCVPKLDRLSQEVIARVILQGFSHEEAGRLLGCTRRTVERNFPDAVDRLSEIFLAAGILERRGRSESKRRKILSRGGKGRKSCNRVIREEKIELEFMSQLPH